MANPRRQWSTAGTAVPALVAAQPAHAAEVLPVLGYHAALDECFTTSDAAEIAARGAAAPPGCKADAGALPTWTWERTGLRVRVQDGPSDGTVPVFRLYSGPFGSRPRHDFAALAAECEAEKLNPYWTSEGIAFHAAAPSPAGAWSSGLAAIGPPYAARRSGPPSRSNVQMRQGRPCGGHPPLGNRTAIGSQQLSRLYFWWGYRPGKGSRVPGRSAAIFPK